MTAMVLSKEGTTTSSVIATTWREKGLLPTTVWRGSDAQLDAWLLQLIGAGEITVAILILQRTQDDVTLVLDTDSEEVWRGYQRSVWQTIPTEGVAPSNSVANCSCSVMVTSSFSVLSSR